METKIVIAICALAIAYSSAVNDTTIISPDKSLPSNYSSPSQPHITEQCVNIGAELQQCINNYLTGDGETLDEEFCTRCKALLENFAVNCLEEALEGIERICPSNRSAVETPSLSECDIKTAELEVCRSALNESNYCTYCRVEFEERVRTCLTNELANMEIGALNSSCINDSDTHNPVPLSNETPQCSNATQRLTTCMFNHSTYGPNHPKLVCDFCLNEVAIQLFSCLHTNIADTHFLLILRGCEEYFPPDTPTLTPPTSPTTVGVVTTSPPDNTAGECTVESMLIDRCLNESVIEEQESSFCTYCRRAVRRYIRKCVKDSRVEVLVTGLAENQFSRICDDDDETDVSDSNSGSTVRITIFSSILLLLLSMITTL